MSKLKEKLTAAMSLPKEIALDLPVVTATGRGEVTVENYKNLMEFTETQIRIRTRDGVITVEGESLTLQQITTEILHITGRIGGVAWS